MRPGHAPPAEDAGGTAAQDSRRKTAGAASHVSSRLRVLRQYATSFASFCEAGTEECGPSQVRAPTSTPSKRTGVERVRLAAIRARSSAPSIALPRARTAAGGRAPPRSRPLEGPWSQPVRWRVALQHRGRRALRCEDRQALRNAVALTLSALPLLVRSGGLGGRVDMYRSPSPDPLARSSTTSRTSRSPRRKPTGAGKRRGAHPLGSPVVGPAGRPGRPRRHVPCALPRARAPGPPHRRTLRGRTGAGGLSTAASTSSIAPLPPTPRPPRGGSSRPAPGAHGRHTSRC